ncbi:cytochrome ubiquinol oxidase subunit I [Desulfococcus sp.]|uniref:cytochrome ubiquinol oxidase subunit I n=1 Tax=Desulfococcus sp. TaxID=2025834 RepID=UPI003D0A6C42
MDLNGVLQYPVWELDVLGGGFWIALIAVVHVYIAHFAVGGGLFIVLTEAKSYRENSPAMLDYVKMHAGFFLVLTAVFGAVTGVGIWFVISVLSPQAASILIHYFFFGWATEWVFFLGEIVTLFVYYYTFGNMERKAHLRMGWLYFILGWLSLFVVNGIVAFMLTPGEWMTTRGFWDGFFNPSFWPSLAFRTAMAFMLAGLFGYVTALAVSDADLRERLLSYCSKWLLIPLPIILGTGWWYIAALPPDQQKMVLDISPETLRFLKIFLWISPVIFTAGILMAFRVGLPVKRGIAGLLVLIGLAYMGSFEFVREAARRPYLIHGYLYANAAPAKAADEIRETGVLKATRWSRYQEITPENRMSVGKDLFKFLCSACHSVGGPMHDILSLTEKFSLEGMSAMLNGMGRINTYMPPFPGNPAERDALAGYIVLGLHGKATEAAVKTEPIPVEMPPFNPGADNYVLLAWNAKGMHCVSDADRYFSFATPGNDIYALLIRRGEIPERITEGVTLHYRLEKDFADPAAHSDFWKYAGRLTGKDPAVGTGISGKRVADTLDYDDASGAYVATAVPVMPYTENGKFMPYPLMTVWAVDDKGVVLAETCIPVPVSTEMGCRSCHGGGWRMDGKAGLSDKTAEDILAVHDRMNKTRLLAQAQDGDPVRCQSCHDAGKAQMNLSAAIHGFHAVHLTESGPEACAACHPGRPEGVTRAYRGIHRQIGLDCTHCHGGMADHALSLLAAERESGKASAERIASLLKPDAVASAEAVNPRKPWVNEPDCLTCHVGFQPPESLDAFNHWTAGEADLYRMRTGGAGLMCAACHGSPHALYPADNPFGNDRDNIPPVQYQGMPYPMGANRNCKVCHMRDMNEEVHHPNSLGMFRNAG